MKKVVLTLCALFFAVNAQAASKSELAVLIERIDNELRYYNQTPEALEVAKEKLEDALIALRGIAPVDPQACIDFAYNEFRRDGYSNTTSLNKAKETCTNMETQGTTLDILSYFYTKIKADGYSVPSSFDYSMNLSRGLVSSQMNCIDSTYGRYKLDGYSVKSSLEKAVNFCRN